MIGQQFQQVWSLDDNIHPLQDEPYKSTFFFFNTPDHEELNAEDASTGSVSHRVSCLCLLILKKYLGTCKKLVTDT